MVTGRAAVICMRYVHPRMPSVSDVRPGLGVSRGEAMAMRTIYTGGASAMWRSRRLLCSKEDWKCDCAGNGWTSGKVGRSETGGCLSIGGRGRGCCRRASRSVTAPGLEVEEAEGVRHTGVGRCAGVVLCSTLSVCGATGRSTGNVTCVRTIPM
jgi:hypothetical protein